MATSVDRQDDGRARRAWLRIFGSPLRDKFETPPDADDAEIDEFVKLLEEAETHGSRLRKEE